MAWIDKYGRVFEQSPFQLLNEAVDSMATKFFGEYFPQVLADDHKFLRRLIMDLGSAPNEEVIPLMGILRRLFSGNEPDEDFVWTDDFLRENMSDDPKFLRGIICRFSAVPRGKVTEIQVLLARHFSSMN